MIIFPRCTSVYPVDSTNDMKAEGAENFRGSKTKIAEGPRRETNSSSTNGSEDIPTKTATVGRQNAR